ncbi:MAG: hypothetical protein LQ346_007404, partial [Caloplaca aetnensis]
MSIAALPPQAVRAIGSSQVLTDSASLVKELVDNALDAQATAITVEISTNTLDIIQLKDNGHGIAPVDRPLVCKRHCTSKIKDLEDLAGIGGASLGFRGEALASAVEMSGSLVVTTRIVGEATAVSLKVSQQGEVENEDRVSQPVGTTIRVTEFLKGLPVRRQTALKDATKQLAKVKRTLQAYAFARPSVRLSLKVLKAKSDKNNWTPSLNIKDRPIVQLFKSYLRSSASTTVDKKITDPFLCMNLVCPPRSYDANVEPAKDDVLFTNSSHVMALVESFLRNHYGGLEPKDKLTTKSNHSTPQARPFDVLMARKPPPATVHHPVPLPTTTLQKEPADCDGDAGIEKPTRSNGDDHVEGGEDDCGDTSSRSRRDGEDHPELFSRPGPSNSAGQSWRNSMYAGDDDGEVVHAILAIGNQSSEEEDEGDIRSITVTNPWTLAKLNAPVRSQKANDQSETGPVRDQQLLTPAKAPEDLLGDLSSPLRIPRPDGIQYLLTPTKSQTATANEQSSPVSFPYPMKAWGKAHREIESSPGQVLSEEQPSSSSMLDTWVQRPPAQPMEEISIPEQDNMVSRPQRDFVSAATLPQGTPLSAIPDISQKPRQRAAQRKQQRQANINKPFTPPVQDLNRGWFDPLELSSSRPPKPSQPRRHRDSLTADFPIDPPQDLEIEPTATSSAPPIHPGLALTMDYERRKAEATAARRALLRQQKQTSQSHLAPTLLPDSSPAIKISASQQSQAFPSSPHRNRYRSAIAALHAPQLSAKETSTPESMSYQDDTPAVAEMDPKDPRSYLIRSKDHRVRRTKTSSLPLETPSFAHAGEYAVIDLVQRVRIDISAFETKMASLLE